MLHEKHIKIRVVINGKRVGIKMNRVLKFGGTSVEDMERMKLIGQQINDYSSGDMVYIVVSAMGDTTDRIGRAVDDAKHGKYADPEDVYGLFENARIKAGNNAGSIALDGHRDAIYLSLHSSLKKAVSDPASLDNLHMTGENLAGIMLCEVLRQSGINSQYIDYSDSGFPLVVRGDFGLATPNLGKTREKAQKARYGTRVIIFPGYGGIDGVYKKILGNGGSDLAAFSIAYAFNADEVRIVTDVSGLKTADLDCAETIPEIDINEAYAIGFFGAKFPSHKAFMPVMQAYDEGSKMVIHVVPYTGMASGGTTIRRHTTHTAPVKFTGGRKVKTFEIEGDWRQLIQDIYGSGIDWYSYGGREGRLNILTSERTAGNFIEKLKKGATEVTEVKERDGETLIEVKKNGNRKRNNTHIIFVSQKNAAIIGVVGNGMGDKHGIKGQVDTALGNAGINLPYTIDPNDVSFGHVIGEDDLQVAKEAIYNDILR